MSEIKGIPIIDIEPLMVDGDEAQAVAHQFSQACREHGFFSIVGHGVDKDLQSDLEQMSRKFFAQRMKRKLPIRLASMIRVTSGNAWSLPSIISSICSNAV